jgi:hypothetical protein
MMRNSSCADARGALRRHQFHSGGGRLIFRDDRVHARERRQAERIACAKRVYAVFGGQHKLTRMVAATAMAAAVVIASFRAEGMS